MNLKILVVWLIKFPLAWFLYILGFSFLIYLALLFAGIDDFDSASSGMQSIIALSSLIIPLYMAIRYGRKACQEIRDYERLKESEALEEERIKQEKKKELELAKKQKQKALEEKRIREKSNIDSIRATISILKKDIEQYEKLFLEKCNKKYKDLVKKVEFEQESLNVLTMRHPIISDFLVTRTTNDLDSEIFSKLALKFRDET